MSSQDREPVFDLESEDEGFCSMKPGPSHEGSQSNSSQSQDRVLSAVSCQGYSGIIIKITVQNFMCHSHLTFTFNERINFLIGRNGAGKSAVLTAICVGLGAKVSTTDRAASLKKLIKTGCQSAVITIVLKNNGEKAYRLGVYGETITVVRTICEKSNQFKLKNHAGAVISSKKEELCSMLSCFNIQIDNPVTILNQTKARTFLTSTNKSKLYELFVHATQIDEMKFLFEEIDSNQKDICGCVKMYEESKDSIKTEIVKLDRIAKILEKTQGMKNRKVFLENELLWAKVHDCQSKIAQHKEGLENCQLQMRDVKTQLDNTVENESKIKQKIAELAKILKRSGVSMKELSNRRKRAKDHHQSLKASFLTKLQDLIILTRTLKSKESELAAVNAEILSLESKGTQSQAGKFAIETSIAELKNKMSDINSAIQEDDQNRYNLKNLELVHQNRLSQITASINWLREERQTLNSQLSNLRSENSLSIYASYMEQLVNRVHQAHAHGQFKKKPIGPLGHYIKVSKEAWAPGVEYLIGHRTLKAFLVDNSKDAFVLKQIMNQVCPKYDRPIIYCSSFTSQVYSRAYQNEAKVDGYENLLRLLDISDVNVTNLLIDTAYIESTLCIDDNDVITGLFENKNTVPRNCLKSINRLGDTFFPAPNFRSYSGLDPSRANRSRLLQVSVTEARTNIQENIYNVEQRLSAFQRDQRFCQSELRKIGAQIFSVSTLRDTKRKELLAARTQLIRLEDEQDAYNEYSHYHVCILKDEAVVLQSELSNADLEVQKFKAEMDNLKAEVRAAKIQYDQLVCPVNSNEEMSDAQQLTVLKEQIKELVIEKRKLLKSLEEATKKVASMEKELLLLKEEEQLHRASAVSIHEDEIIDTRDYDTVYKELKEASMYLTAVESKMGVSYEKICVTLQKKRNEYNHLSAALVKLEKLLESYNCLVESRKELLSRYVSCTTAHVKMYFQSVLCMRQFEGKLKIDHSEKNIDIFIIPEKNLNLTSLKSLSGGERSYSTVAFVMALWLTTDIPFYSMDEFDVFMDPVNREYIMQILLKTAEMKPDSQFIFLTPNDMSKKVKVSENLSLFRLQDPKRQT